MVKLCRIDWQDTPLSEPALRRIEGSAGLALRVSGEEKRHIRLALQRLANIAIHRAFDHSIDARQVKRVRAWADRKNSTETAQANLTKVIADVRPLGPFPCPPPEHRERKALEEWLEFHSEGKSRGRPRLHFDDKLTHLLCVCYRHLFRVKPDASRGNREIEIDDYRGGSRCMGGAARFIHAFYREVDHIIRSASIPDPQRRGRMCTWRVPTIEIIAKRLRSVVEQRDWLGWQVMSDGEILATTARPISILDLKPRKLTGPPVRQPWMRPRLADVLAPLPPKERRRHVAALCALSTESERNAYIAKLSRPSARGAVFAI